MHFVGFTGDDAPRAVLLSVVCRPMMLGIMAGMNQTDIFALFFDPCRGAEVFSHGPECSSDH